MAKLEEAVGVLEELVVDLVDKEQRSDREPLGENPLEVALSVLTANFDSGPSIEPPDWQRVTACSGSPRIRNSLGSNCSTHVVGLGMVIRLRRSAAEAIWIGRPGT